MWWRTKDGKLHQPYEMAVVLTMDYWTISMESEEENKIHLLRDYSIEMGLKKTKRRIERDILINRGMTSKDFLLEDKYNVMGAWLMEMIDITNNKPKIKDKEEDENEECEEVTENLVPESPELIKKKQSEYIR